MPAATRDRTRDLPLSVEFSVVPYLEAVSVSLNVILFFRAEVIVFMRYDQMCAELDWKKHG